MRGRYGSMTRLMLSPDGGRLLTGHGDGWLHVWALPDEPSVLELYTPTEGETVGVFSGTSSVNFSVDGTALLTASRDGRARVWNPVDKREALAGNRCAGGPMGPNCLASQTFMAHGPGLTRAIYSPDGGQIATSGENGSVIVWDAATSEEVSRPSGVGARVADLAYSPDSRLLAVASQDGLTRLVEPGTGLLVAYLKSSDSDVYDVEFTPDGSGLVTVAADGAVRLWDVERRSSRLLFDADSTIIALAVDPTGRFVAVAVDEQVIQLDLRDGHRIRTMAGHRGPVSSLAFAGGGDMLMSGGTDATVRVWDLHSGDQATMFRTTCGYVTDVDVDPTGRRVASGTTEGAVYLFDCLICTGGNELARLAATRTTRVLTADERSRFSVA
jgi:WD40 repeat protein